MKIDEETEPIAEVAPTAAVKPVMNAWTMMIEDENVEEALDSVSIIWPEGLNRVDTSPYPGWSRITFTVDSGASEAVIGLNALEGVPLTQGVAARNGVKYECANGAVIENLGQKQFVGTWFESEYDERGISRPMIAQVTSVNKALLSVGRLEEGGYDVHFGGAENSYILDKSTGEWMWMVKEGSVYTLELWVKDAALAPVFSRQGH